MKRINSDAIMARRLLYTLLTVALRKCFFLGLVQFPLSNVLYTHPFLKEILKKPQRVVILSRLIIPFCTLAPKHL